MKDDEIREPRKTTCRNRPNEYALEDENQCRARRAFRILRDAYREKCESLVQYKALLEIALKQEERWKARLISKERILVTKETEEP